MLYWLVYRQGRSRAVLVLEGALIAEARIRANVETVPGIDACFVEGHELAPAIADRMPRAAIGRLMTPGEAEQLLAGLERPRR